MNDLLYILDTSYNYYGLYLILLIPFAFIPLFLSLKILFKENNDTMMLFGGIGAVAFLFLLFLKPFSDTLYKKKDQIKILLDPKYSECVKDFPYLKDFHLIRFDYEQTFLPCKVSIDIENKNSANTNIQLCDQKRSKNECLSCCRRSYRHIDRINSRADFKKIYCEKLKNKDLLNPEVYDKALFEKDNKSIIIPILFSSEYLKEIYFHSCQNITKKECIVSCTSL